MAWWGCGFGMVWLRIWCGSHVDMVRLGCGYGVVRVRIWCGMGVDIVW